eukprot:g8176.t1
MGCQICDGNCEHSFDAFKTFRTHLRTQHDASVCGICFSANRYFPRELTIFTNHTEVQEHLKTHPECLYCRQRYFGKDELYAHMSRKHWLCHLCHAQGHRHRYLEDSRHYAEHLRQEHFACNAQECRESFIAFATSAELEEHVRNSHPERQRQRPSRSYHLSNQATQSQRNQPATSIGYNVIDDDSPPDQTLDNQQGGWDATRPRRLVQNEESFPPLPSGGGTRRENTVIAPRVPARKMCRASCSCGRIVRSLLLPIGQTMNLTCDDECERIKRRAQLANAFNINPVSYTGAFPQNSSASSGFSIDLITWARTQPNVVKSLEDDLCEFILTNNSQRLKLTISRKEDRKLAVELVERYGLVGRDDRNGGFVEVIRTPHCALPSQKLIHYATSLTPEQYEAEMDEALKFTILFEQIPAKLNLESFLREWSGEYKVQFTSKTTAKVAFRCARSFNAASRALIGDTTNGFIITLPRQRNQ